MAITGNKFEAYHSITATPYGKKGKNLTNDSIIRIALEDYDVNLTLNDIEIMRKDYCRYVIFYKYLL